MRSRRTSCRRSRAARRSCTPGRSATSRTAATASSPRAPALALGDVVVTEAGFGSDLGAEKFFDIKCRVGGLESGGGGPRRDRAIAQDAGWRRQARARASAIWRRSSAGCRISSTTSRNVRQFGVPVVVGDQPLHRRHRGRADDGARLRGASSASTSRCARCGRRAAPAAKSSRAKCMALLDGRTRELRAASTTSTQPVRDKIETIVQTVYGGDGVDYSPAAARAIDNLESIGLHHTPMCMAKTQYSLTDDPVAARPSDRVPHHRQRGLRLRGRRLRRRARPATS